MNHFPVRFDSLWTQSLNNLHCFLVVYFNSVNALKSSTDYITFASKRKRKCTQGL